VRVPVSLNNPGIVDPPPTIDVDAATADGSKAVEAVASGHVEGVAHGLAAPVVQRGLKTTTPEYDDLQELTIPMTLERATPLLAVQATALDGPGLAVNIYRDVDRDGRWTPVDYSGQVELDRPYPGPQNEADAPRLAPGPYLVQINAIEPYDKTVTFDLRTWNVDDPTPDDPQPAPGIVLDGDGDNLPGDSHEFDLRWNGVSGTEPLRGIVEWLGDGEDNVLARSVVRVSGQGQ
jgi:hypothetical protein